MRVADTAQRNLALRSSSAALIGDTLKISPVLCSTDPENNTSRCSYNGDSAQICVLANGAIQAKVLAHRAWRKYNGWYRLRTCWQPPHSFDTELYMQKHFLTAVRRSMSFVGGDGNIFRKALRKDEFSVILTPCRSIVEQYGSSKPAKHNLRCVSIA